MSKSSVPDSMNADAATSAGRTGQGGHTPGPWTLTETAFGEWSIDGADGTNVTVMGAGDDTVEADARLIAAAPDLLAALEGLIAEIGADWPDEWHAGAYEEAVSAIAKAEGGVR